MSVRRILKYLLYIALTFFVFILSGYLYVFQFGGLENIVNDKLSSLVDEKYLLDIEINEINGNYVSGFVLENIDIYYNDSLNRYRIVRIPKLKTAYSFSNLWDKKYMLNFLTIDSAEITLIRDSANNWIIPDFRPKKNSTSMLKLPSFSIGTFDISNMSVTLLDKGDSVRFKDIFLSLELKSEEKSYAFDIEKFQFSSNQDDIHLSTAGGQITFDNSNLLFQNVALVTSGTRLKLDGNINLAEKPSGAIDFAIDNLDLTKIARHIGPKLKGVVDLNGKVQFSESEISGSATIGGSISIVDIQNALVDFSYKDKILSFDTLIGTVFGECDIVGSGYIDFTKALKSYHLNADVKQFNLKSLINNSFSSNLSGSIVMDGSGFKKENFQLKFDAELLESQFDDYPIHAASGHLEMDGDSIRFFEPFLIEYFENVFSVDGTIVYRDEMDLHVTADLKNLDRYQQKLFIDQPGGRGFAEFVLDGKTIDPNLKGYFLSDSVWIYGLYADSLYATIDIDNFLHAKQGFVEVGFTDGFAWAVPYDSGYTYLTIDSNIVHIENSTFANKFTNIATNGRFDYEAVPNLLTLDSLYLNLARQSFYNRDAIVVEIDSLGFVFEQASIGFVDQWLAVNGRTNFNETFDLLFSINHIPIKPWKNLYEDSLSVDGIVSCEASLKGSFKNPEFVLRGQIDSLAYQELVLGDLNTVLSYKNNKLTIDSVVVFAHPGNYRAEGYMYIDLEFTSGDINRFPNYPMHIQCNATDSRFDLVSHFLPSVENIDGNFFADFILSGTPNKPHLKGEAYIKSYYDETNKLQPARLKYFDLEAPIYTDSAGVTMSDNRIQIDRIDTYVREDERKRHAFIEGNLTVKTLGNLYYDLTVEIPEPMPFVYELDDIRGKVKTQKDTLLYIQGDTPPLVMGGIEISEMKYDVNFAEVDQGSPIMLALEGENSWDLNIGIIMPANYWIRNEDISAEFAGEINLKRTDGLYSFGGEMEILHGNGYLFDKKIRLDPGGVVVFQGDDKFNPVLDITGYTTISGTRDNLEEDNSSEQLRLGLHITGTLEEPIINVTEDSDFESNEEIIPLLIANYSGGNTEVTNSVEERVVGLLSTQVSQIGIRYLGVETFEVDAQYTAGQIDPNKTRVTLGAYLAPKFYTYGRFGTTRREIGVEYRLSRYLLMQGLSDEDGLYHLNLKFNKEFE